ncbi:hypothetical protein [Nocardiopsis sp. ATB16-24]|uniref:hypothetical protein n=1 Tax=Nocardiopsis sp. ATB16-24 TaxID=3019555 RepID=UPI002554BF7C|nr:hypothetical protein [Nocardiopsis sp. ATB16-24]
MADDYDVLTTAGRRPPASFVPLVPDVLTIGVGLVVRRVAGTEGRGGHEPSVQAMREIGTSAPMVSGGRDEGRTPLGVYAAERHAGRGA